ncbi:MAG: CHRD domain-containing protein [Bacteroidetes bacterium]|nr:CHRD domain-containing protein [Bacteroidota bacterium]
MEYINKLLLTAFAAFFSNAALAHTEFEHTGNLLVTARLDGSQSIPAVTTNASGIASVFINSTMDTAKIQVTVNGLSGGITGIHIHEGKKGSSGAVVTDLATKLVGNTSQLLIAGTSLTKTWISKLLSGQYYINIHTLANPGGEIRGQLTLETDWSFTAWVNGAQQVPSVTTTAYGMVVFNLNKDNSTIEYKGVFDGLSGAVTGIHLHTGAKGSTGGVVLDLSGNYSNKVLMGSADPSSFLADLMLGNIYINLHTALNPNGEIRGQLGVDNHLAFDAWMNGAKAGTPVPEVALASVKIATTLDTIWYNIASNLDVKDTINGLHFHHSMGILDLDAGLNGNMAMGMVTGSELTAKIIQEFMAGTIYLAFHSKAIQQ